MQNILGWQVAAPGGGWRGFFNSALHTVLNAALHSVLRVVFSPPCLAPLPKTLLPLPL